MSSRIKEEKCDRKLVVLPPARRAHHLYFSPPKNLKLLSAATKLSFCDEQAYLYPMFLFVLNTAALVNNASRCIEEEF
jgi:hypothetical protein